MVLFAASLYAETPTAKSILEKVDGNLVPKNRVSTTTMIVKGERATRTMTSRSYGVGSEKAFTEYLSPPRDAGTKMLKLDDELWTWSPSSDRIIKIAGHLLRQSLFGSDISYEDFMEDKKLSDNYDVTLSDDETFNGRQCYVLSLYASKEDCAYHARKLWVDKERFLPLQQQLFAKSGKLLKTFTIDDVWFVQGRWYPKQITFKDVMQKGDGTHLVFDTIEFDVEIPEYLFSKGSLKR